MKDYIVLHLIIYDELDENSLFTITNINGRSLYDEIGNSIVLATEQDFERSISLVSLNVFYLI
jgi:hypothetical protein